uniref:polynucleotide adenylyltransferase n=1 Tax=Fusarium oxysporum (strain Fo5176) TaxID=660025 RepID=A0A0D2XBE1_FUSOF
MDAQTTTAEPQHPYPSSPWTSASTISSSTPNPTTPSATSTHSASAVEGSFFPDPSATQFHSHLDLLPFLLPQQSNIYHAQLLHYNKLISPSRGGGLQTPPLPPVISAPHIQAAPRSRSSSKVSLRDASGKGSTAGGHGSRSHQNLDKSRSVATSKEVPSKMSSKQAADSSRHLPRRSAPSAQSHSSSVPSTPHQHARQFSLEDREPSPTGTNNHSPRSAYSETHSTLSSLQPLPPRISSCKYETAQINSRRRIPYSVGNDRLEKLDLRTVKSKLTEDEERKLATDMREVYDRLLPTAAVEENRKKLVSKLEKTFNDEWPGHDIRVNLFGSSGNLLCSDDSDVDICITTTWRELEDVCMIANLLAKPFGGTLSSYTWICLIIAFLQLRSPPVLPALHQSPHKLPKPDGTTPDFADDIDKLAGYGKKNKSSTAELLFQFFRFYAHEFDYDKHVLSVRHGKLITKHEKKWHYAINNQLCVEEPFNTSRNLGNTADDYSFRGLHMELRRAFDLISMANFEEACEQYVFPKEEERVWSRPAPQPRPALLRSSSQTHSGRGGRGNHRGGRHNNNYRGGNSNRRASAGVPQFDANNNNMFMQPVNMAQDLQWYQNQQFQFQYAQQDLMTQMALHQENMRLLYASQSPAFMQHQAQAQAQAMGQQQQQQRMSTSTGSGQQQPQQTSDRSRTNSFDNPPLSAPIRPDLYALYGMTLGTPFFPQAGTSYGTYPSSPASTSGATQDFRRPLQRNGINNETGVQGSNSALRSHSQPASRSPSTAQAAPGYFGAQSYNGPSHSRGVNGNPIPSFMSDDTEFDETPKAHTDSPQSEEGKYSVYLSESPSPSSTTSDESTNLENPLQIHGSNGVPNFPVDGPVMPQAVPEAAMNQQGAYNPVPVAANGSAAPMMAAAPSTADDPSFRDRIAMMSAHYMASPHIVQDPMVAANSRLSPSTRQRLMSRQQNGMIAPLDLAIAENRINRPPVGQDFAHLSPVYENRTPSPTVLRKDGPWKSEKQNSPKTGRGEGPKSSQKTEERAQEPQEGTKSQKNQKSGSQKVNGARENGHVRGARSETDGGWQKAGKGKKKGANNNGQQGNGEQPPKHESERKGG